MLMWTYGECDGVSRPHMMNDLDLERAEWWMAALGPPVGGGYDLDIFTENPDDDLLCSICHGVLRCPVMISCGHIFCRKCILQWLKRQQTCPCCRTEVRGKPYVQMHKLKKKINSLQVKCPNEQNGCPALFPLLRSEEHAESCAFGLVVCTNDGCPAQVMRKDIGDHSQSCEYWSEMCHMGCGALLTPANRDQHNCYMELKETYNKQLHKLRQKARRMESLSSQMSRQIQLLSGPGRHRGSGVTGSQALPCPIMPTAPQRSALDRIHILGLPTA